MLLRRQSKPEPFLFFLFHLLLLFVFHFCIYVFYVFCGEKKKKSV